MLNRLLLIITLSGISSLRAQEYVYRHYGLQSGLPNPTIHSFFQDRDGFLWIGTESGLCRYDGSRFTTFTARDGLAGNEVFGMTQDYKGRIWMQQYTNSVTYLWKGKIHNRQNDSLLHSIQLNYRVVGLVEDADSNIVLCDYEKIYFLEKGERVSKIITSADLGVVSFINLYVDSAKHLIVASAHALYRLNGKKLVMVKRLTPEEGGELGPNNLIYHHNYITYALHEFQRQVFLRDTTVEIELPEKVTIKFSPLSDSVFSINTGNGAFLFNIHTLSLTRMLPGIRVSNVFIDKENNLWLGTIGDGMYKVSSRDIVNRSLGNNGKDIYYISKQGNKIILGNNNAEVYEISPGRIVKKIIPRSSGTPLWKIYYYEQLGPDDEIIGMTYGVAHLQKGTLKDSQSGLIVKTVVEEDAQHLLAAALKGLFRLRKTDLRITDTIWNHRCLSVLKTGDSMLVGTTDGIMVMRLINNVYKLADALLPGCIINHLKKTADNGIWVATNENGLYCFHNGKLLKSFCDTSGLPGNSIRSLYLQQNTIWAGTDKGLSKITPEGENFRIQNFSVSDGLPSDIINVIYVDGHTIYLGTTEGLCYFDERKLETNSICNLVLTGVQVGDRPVPLQQRYEVKRQQRITIEYAGISLRSENDMIYRYRISDIDEQWRTTRLNILEFTSLPYGEYQLEIVAENKFGKQSKPVLLSLHINRPFYRTAWFIALMVILPLTAGVIWYNRRVRLVKQKQVEKLQQEIKMLELEQMALRAQMNPHFIFNCINALQQMLSEDDTANAGKFITSFSSLVRQTLDNAPELFIPLNEEIKFLENYFALEKLRLEDRFTYAIHTDGIQQMHLLKIPNMVTQPFVENAIRHGIRYKKNGKGRVEVLYEQREQHLRCIISDNGIGREKAAELKKISGEMHLSKGMGISMKRVEALNSMRQGNITIEVQDLKNELHQPAGTRVIIDFIKDVL